MHTNLYFILCTYKSTKLTTPLFGPWDAHNAILPTKHRNPQGPPSRPIWIDQCQKRKFSASSGFGRPEQHQTRQSGGGNGIDTGTDCRVQKYSADLHAAAFHNPTQDGTQQFPSLHQCLAPQCLKRTGTDLYFLFFQCRYEPTSTLPNLQYLKPTVSLFLEPCAGCCILGSSVHSVQSLRSLRLLLWAVIISGPCPLWSAGGAVHGNCGFFGGFRCLTSAGGGCMPS